MLPLTTAAAWISMGPFSLALPLGVSLYQQACGRRLGAEAKQNGYIVSERRRNWERPSSDRIGGTADILPQRNRERLRAASASGGTRTRNPRVRTPVL